MIVRLTLRIPTPRLRRHARVTGILCPRCDTWRTARQWRPTDHACTRCTDRSTARRARAAWDRITYRNAYTDLGRTPGTRGRIASVEFGPTPGAAARPELPAPRLAAGAPQPARWDVAVSGGN